MFDKSGFKPLDERLNFIKSDFGQFLINSQVEQFNSIQDGDIHKVSSLLQTIISYLNNLMFVDEKYHVTLTYDDLNPKVYDAACYGAYEDIAGTPTITIDERFKYLTHYTKYPHLNKIQFNDDVVSTDDKMLFYSLITLLHEFEHYNQDVLLNYINSSKQNAKDAKNEFSADAIKATTYTCELDLGIEKDMPSEILKTMAKLTGISTFDFVKEHMPYTPSDDEEVYDEIIDLINKMEDFEYKESIYEVDARVMSYKAVVNLLNMYLNHPNISDNSKAFINRFLSLMKDREYVYNELEILKDYDIYFALIENIRNLDNEQLFKHICKYKYPYPSEENSSDYKRKNKLSNKLAYFLVKKGFNTIKEYFEYVVTKSPSDFSFWVADTALRASQNYGPTQKEIFTAYYKYLKKQYTNNNLKPEQISFLFLNDSQKSKLLTIFLNDKRWDMACKIMEDLDFNKYTSEHKAILKAHEEEFLKYVTTLKYVDVYTTYCDICGTPDIVNTK